MICRGHWQGLTASLVLVCLAAVTAGCGGGDAPDRYMLEGTVTFDGQPVPEGSVAFFPSGDKGNAGPAGNAKIVNGRYTTVESGTGVVGGPHRIVINGFDGNADPAAEMPSGKPLFLDYEIQYDLPAYEKGQEAEAVNFDVPRDAAKPKAARAPSV